MESSSHRNLSDTRWDGLKEVATGGKRHMPIHETVRLRQYFIQTSVTSTGGTSDRLSENAHSVLGLNRTRCVLVRYRVDL